MAVKQGYGQPKASSIRANWQQPNLSLALSDTCQNSLQKYLGISRAEAVQELFRFIQQRLMQHKKTSFSLGSTIVGKLSAKSCQQLNGALQLLVTLVTERRAPIDDLVNNVTDPQGLSKKLVGTLGENPVSAPVLHDLNNLSLHQQRIADGLSALLGLDFRLKIKLNEAFAQEKERMLQTFSSSVVPMNLT